MTGGGVCITWVLAYSCGSRMVHYLVKAPVCHMLVCLHAVVAGDSVLRMGLYRSPVAGNAGDCCTVYRPQRRLQLHRLHGHQASDSAAKGITWPTGGSKSRPHVGDHHPLSTWQWPIDRIAIIVQYVQHPAAEGNTVITCEQMMENCRRMATLLLLLLLLSLTACILGLCSLRFTG